ncbi:hypothetical protein GCM10010496_32670 [Streptomyces asoensis]|nr:hypothetical protein GCM10010496_32670 [Streptomyces asoensis]
MEVVEQAAQLGVHLLPGRPAVSRPEPAGQLEQAVTPAVGQMQDSGEYGEQGGRRLDAALLQPCVVVGADGGEHGDLFSAQPRHTSATGVGQTDGARGQLGPPLLGEFSQLVRMRFARHGASVALSAGREGGKDFSPG